MKWYAMLADGQDRRVLSFQCEGIAHTVCVRAGSQEAARAGSQESDGACLRFM